MQRNVKSKLCTNPLHVRVWSKQNQKYQKIPKNQACSISTDPISKLSNKNLLKNLNFTVKKSNEVAIKTASVLLKTCDFEDLTVRYINLSLTHLSFNLHVLAYRCMYIYLLFVCIYVNVLLWRFYFWKKMKLYGLIFDGLALDVGRRNSLSLFVSLKTSAKERETLAREW